ETKSWLSLDSLGVLEESGTAIACPASSLNIHPVKVEANWRDFVLAGADSHLFRFCREPTPHH
ncbi:hypothetical protein, partial [Lapillicoccus sp.]|uniref:hypothetical protein n=1 Tax=Lapillicoccus sp. TaxID=1909287 RepID=UPI003982EE01